MGVSKLSAKVFSKVNYSFNIQILKSLSCTKTWNEKSRNGTCDFLLNHQQVLLALEIMIPLAYTSLHM